MALNAFKSSPYTFSYRSQGCSRLFKVHRNSNAGLHHIDASMQTNAQRTSCCYLSLVTEGHTVCEITGFLVDRGHQPTRISCLLQNLYIKSLWKVTPRWHRRRARALSSELRAASAADGSGAIMHQNNPFMYFRYDFSLLEESGGWRGGSVLESRDQVLCMLVFELETSHVGVLFSAYGVQDIFFNLRWTEVPPKASAPSFSLILFAQSFYISAPLPPCLPKRSDSVTNFIQYFCQCLYFPFTSTHSLVSAPLFHAVHILVWTSHFQCR